MWAQSGHSFGLDVEETFALPGRRLHEGGESVSQRLQFRLGKFRGLGLEEIGQQEVDDVRADPGRRHIGFVGPRVLQGGDQHLDLDHVVWQPHSGELPHDRGRIGAFLGALGEHAFELPMPLALKLGDARPALSLGAGGSAFLAIALIGPGAGCAFRPGRIRILGLLFA